MLLIGCRGGDPDAPEILKRAGWQYGSRSDYKIYAAPAFIDIKWRNYDWLRHWSVVRRWKPQMAMVADYERPAQKCAMLRQVAQIMALGVRPMVCPKFSGAVADIPGDCIVAISVPTTYAGYMPTANELYGRELHLLGGHPDQFVILMRRYKKSRIVSIDSSVMFLKANFGAYWSLHHNDWQYVEKNAESTDSLIARSATNIAEYLNHPPRYLRWNNRTRATGYNVQMAMFSA